MKRGALAIIAMLVVIAPSAAWAGDAFEEVLKDYKGDANISPCKHSEKTLRDAAEQVPNDIEQFVPDFPEALGNAIAARAQGACEGKAISKLHRLFGDCADGTIDERWSSSLLRKAIDKLPADIDEFTACTRSLLRRALKAAIRRGCKASGVSCVQPVARWPAEKKAWTVILLSATSRTEAEKFARNAKEKGIEAGILDGGRYKNQTTGVWLVWAGRFKSENAAFKAADGYAEKGVEGETTEYISKKDQD